MVSFDYCIMFLCGVMLQKPKYCKEKDWNSYAMDIRFDCDICFGTGICSISIVYLNPVPYFDEYHSRNSRTD